MKKAFLILPMVVLATIALLPLNQKLVPLFHLHITGNAAIDRMVIAQLLTLVLVALVLLVVRWISPDGFRRFWRLGDFAAPATKVPWLGIREGESWRSVGLGFSVAITAVTGVFMWYGVYKDAAITWLSVLPWVLIFSATNAFSEEMLCRFSLVTVLDGVISRPAICAWSAAIFGGVHYFGTPGGPVGVLMAGFLGWLLAKSMLETRGFGWAWFIHFLQDVVILFALLGKME